MSKPRLILDFDGVLHLYASGWHGPEVITDPPVPGARQFCIEAMEAFEVWIVSTRCSSPGGADAIKRWLELWEFPPGLVVSPDGKKPPALVMIDDRAITFDGTWPTVKVLLDFKPWYAK